MGKKHKSKNRHQKQAATDPVAVAPAAVDVADAAKEPVAAAPPVGGRFGPWPKVTLLFVIGAAVAFAIWPAKIDPVMDSGTLQGAPRVEPLFADFVGAEACAGCHAHEYEVWKRSTHGQAGGELSEVRLIARFDGKPLRFKDAVVTPLVTPAGEHVFQIEIQGQPPAVAKADLVVGGGHMYGGGTQSFFSRFPDGSVRFLPFDFIRDESLWFVQLKKGGVWAPVSTEISLQNDLANWPPHRVLGVHAGLSTCQNCHGSQISILPDAGSGRFDTRFTSLRINCESCHGAGKRHIEIVTKPGFEKLDDIGMEPLATLSKDQSLAVCFQCHAGKNILRPDCYFPAPGTSLAGYMSLKLPLLDGSRFLVDGRIRLFGYQANHLYSDCYLSGSMTCVDCHDPHSQEYRDVNFKPLKGKFDDGQCTGCHASKAAHPERHSHHRTGSPGNLCTSCHMPFLQHQGLGTQLRFARSDHTIPIPRPEFDAGLGIENACLKCHEDLGTAALQAKVDEWYGEIKPHHPLIANLIEAKGVTDPKVAQELLLDPTADHPMAQMDGLFTFLRRFLRPGAKPSDRDVIAKLVVFTASDDLDLKSVALMALQAIYGEDVVVRRFLRTSVENLGEQEAAIKARWAASADQLGGIFVDMKELPTAAKYMESAAMVSDDDVAIKSHLALTYVLLGKPELALPPMLDAIRVAPKDADLRVQLAMCYLKLRRIPDAVIELEAGLKLAPGDQEARRLLEQIRAANRRK